MAAITAAMVGELRAKTDAPMMECKKALTEAEGNMDKAEELLRVKLGGKASKASSRITAEGVVATYIANGVGALIEVNSETDFVAKNDDFLNLANTAARPPFAVAVNTTFVPNTRYAAHPLQPGDRVEIISPVTGG
eukprot:gene40257-biopygen34185